MKAVKKNWPWTALALATCSLLALLHLAPWRIPADQPNGASAQHATISVGSKPLNEETAHKQLSGNSPDADVLQKYQRLKTAAGEVLLPVNRVPIQNGTRLDTRPARAAQDARVLDFALQALRNRPTAEAQQALIMAMKGDTIYRQNIMSKWRLHQQDKQHETAISP